MQSEIRHNPDAAIVHFRFEAVGEQVTTEAGAMVGCDSAVEMTTHIQGGLGGALRTKVVRQDSLFKNVFTATAPGQTLSIAPGSEGAIDTAMIDTDKELYLQSTSLLAWTSGVVLDTHSQRGRNIFASKAFLVRAYGRGQIWFSAHGAFHTIEIGGAAPEPRRDGAPAAPTLSYDGYVCESGHLVAYTSSLKLHTRKVAAIKNYFRQGGGHLAELRGEGRLWLQTKNTTALLHFLHPFRRVGRPRE